MAAEAEHLAGHPALFPAEQRRLEESLREGRQHVAMQARMGEIDGWLPSGEPETPEEREAIVARLAGDFVEPAKVQALEKLDEGRRAYGIAERWLRPKLASRPESPPWSPGVGEPTAQHRQGDARRGGSEG